MGILSVVNHRQRLSDKRSRRPSYASFRSDFAVDLLAASAIVVWFLVAYFALRTVVIAS
jgi:hypothetical protein